MGVLNSSRKVMKDFIEKSYSMGQLHGEMKKINDPRRQKLIETVHLTKAEENKIDTLFTANYGKKIKYDWHRLYQSFTGKFDENLPVYLKEINISLIEYIEAFALSALIQGLTTAFVYLVIGHPNWILLGIFSAISSVIPYVGPIVANLLGIVTSITMGTTKLIILFVLIFIQSNVVPYVIQPKIYSSKIDLSIMWVLFGILTGSTLFGAWGMIIAMPILVTIKISYRVYRQHNPQPKNA